jgi:ribonuclease HII
MAEVDDGGRGFLSRRLPKAMRCDLDDSKKLVAFGKHALAEAWARALYPDATSPRELYRAMSLPSEETQRARCPKRAEPQCWTLGTERFQADEATVSRVSGHLARLRKHGVNVLAVRTEAICVGALNDERANGENRFTSDLHAMERLVLALREAAGSDVRAVCGKVGGISDYERFFGPLSGRLRICLERSRARSSYRFPGLGDLHFVRDADAADPLVMLASLIGKYVRELLMARIVEFYQARVQELRPCSGYHDPVTAQFVELTRGPRKHLRVPLTCFERNSEV